MLNNGTVSIKAVPTALNTTLWNKNSMEYMSPLSLCIVQETE